jgi:hypothetical protein
LTTSSTLLPSGAQRPRIFAAPPASSSAGREAVQLAQLAGLHLDPWQAFVLEHALAEGPGGKWAAFEIGVVVPRQNGKGALLEARELAGLFLLGERMIIHSAHQFDTSLEAFYRLLGLIEGTPDLSRRVKRVSKSHGEEGIELTSGQRIRFRTRTKGGGRGFSCDCLILDEAMILPEVSQAALLPTLAARPNPQVWYTGSAVDQRVHEHGIVLTRVRERGIRGDEEGLAYFEWSVAAELAEAVDERVATAPESWAQANPGLAIRMKHEHVAREQRSMDPRSFGVERLGAGDWPDTSKNGGVIPLSVWQALADSQSHAVDPVCFAIDMPPDRSVVTIAAAGRRPDGLRHVEIVDRLPAHAVVDRLVELTRRHKHVGLVVDPKSPAGSLISDLNQRLNFEVTEVTANEHAQACGMLYDAATAEEPTLRHLGTPELEAAIKGALKRTLGDAWAWARKAGTDVSPLVAATLANWGSITRTPAQPWVVVA